MFTDNIIVDASVSASAAAAVAAAAAAAGYRSGWRYDMRFDRSYSGGRNGGRTPMGGSEPRSGANKWRKSQLSCSFLRTTAEL